jgi:glycosyltransferase involved in cell wall biosynthesis
MRVVAFVQEPLSNAGSRCRIAALRPGLAARGIDLTICPPMSDRLAGWCRAGGAWRRVLYYALFLLGRLRDIPRATRADAVIIFRGMFPIGRPWMEWVVRRLNRNLIFDFDDAIFLRPPFATGGYRWVDLRAPAKVLRRARAAVVGSPWLEEFALRHCLRVVVIPTCLDMAFHSPSPRAGEGEGGRLVIGWVGSRSGFAYLHALDDVWRDIQKRHGVAFRIVSNGRYKADGLPVENIPWTLDGEIDQLRSFDVGLMPLFDGPFERAKAGFKLIEYLAVGVAAVASPVGVNREICGEDESRGLLAATPDEWREKIERLIADADLRRRLGQAGREFVLREYDLSRAVDAWASLLTEVTGPGQASAPNQSSDAARIPQQTPAGRT